MTALAKDSTCHDIKSTLTDETIFDFNPTMNHTFSIVCKYYFFNSHVILLLCNNAKNVSMWPPYGGRESKQIIEFVSSGCRITGATVRRIQLAGLLTYVTEPLKP